MKKIKARFPPDFPSDSGTDSRDFARCGSALLAKTIVCSAFNVSAEEIESPDRGIARIAFARQGAAYLAHVGLGISQTTVARHYGRHRSTISHACRVVEMRRDQGDIDWQFDRLEVALTVMAAACGLNQKMNRPKTNHDGGR